MASYRSQHSVMPPYLPRGLEESQHLRIVLVGKTGAGKSASGNTILQRAAFTSRMSPRGVTSECKKESGVFENTLLAVVDTPGLFDRRMSAEDVKREISKCISFAAPGPHVFLVVIQPNRFTDEELQTVRMLQIMFGAEAAKHMMVLFTHGDELERNNVAIETFIIEDPDLSQFVHQCGGGYHLFNNEDRRNTSQVKNLLMKISQMLQRHHGRYYTNETFEAAQRAVVDRTREILQRNPNMSHENAQALAESDNGFIVGVLSGAAGVAGAIGLGALLLCNIEVAALGAIVLSGTEVAAGVGSALAQMGSAAAASVGTAAAQACTAAVQMGNVAAAGAVRIVMSKAPCVIQ